MFQRKLIAYFLQISVKEIAYQFADVSRGSIKQGGMSLAHDIAYVDYLEEVEPSEERIVIGDQSVAEVERKYDLVVVEEVLLAEQDADNSQTQFEGEGEGVDVGIGGAYLLTDRHYHEDVSDLDVGGQYVYD